MAEKTYSAGIDVGSTTVKLAVTDADGKTVFGRYARHFADIRQSLIGLLREAEDQLGDIEIKAMITGSGGMNLSKLAGIGFIQEVVAESEAIGARAPETDVAIELGGEDAKIIYFRGGLDERMNGVCAGGTGSFIDQMAALLKTDAEGLNELAKDYSQLYPIAARCGVFAKSDIQPLINDGAAKEDIAASVFQAVVNQTIGGLACGKPIKGRIAFLGGPLHFLTELKKAFVRTLKLSPDEIIAPEDAHLFPALGASKCAENESPIALSKLITRLENSAPMGFELKRLPPLFRSEDDYKAFLERHARHTIKRGSLSEYRGDCFLGIDAGSTTTKLALIDSSGRLLWSFYSGNDGSPVATASRALSELKKELPEGVEIKRSCSTGYGESLLKTAFSLDCGEVETIAHYRAASFFDPETDCLLDIGGQDMKYITIRDRSVADVLLNEACSSGCGSFLENFAVSLGHTAESFAREALFAPHPVDLGTRCTVFMNSNVKQAQKEGATLCDISAGLAYSVVKNALFKVIKLTDADMLGTHIMVQGGTFCNHAVLRAFELLTGKEAVCPDIAGLMGAFGAALIARDNNDGTASVMLSLDETSSLKYKTTVRRCGGCRNNCLLTVNDFGTRKHISGNRCERGAGMQTHGERGVNLVAYKKKRIFEYSPLAPEKASRGVIGIPRVLNIYEDFPFWAEFFASLGFSVVLSPETDRKIYELGMDSIPSESECYPAKLAHGHVQYLVGAGVKTIFYPSVFYERKEPGSQNCYNCPIVIGDPENIKNNLESLKTGEARFIHPFISFKSEKTLSDCLVRVMREEFNIPAGEVRSAAKRGWKTLEDAKEDIRREGQKTLAEMERKKGSGIVLASRPYHCDPEINHGIPEMIASYGLYVFTEDSIPRVGQPTRPIRVNDQWSYHSRLYAAAEFVRSRDDLELVQLNSFGCGLDAVTTDQVAEILTGAGKLYTVLKIDEVNNLGAARIRIRSLLAARNMRLEKNEKRDIRPMEYKRTSFTEKMKAEKYTILAPQMAPIHFAIIRNAFEYCGYNLEILGNDTRASVDMGLKCVNNDACYPSLIVTGQILDAVLSGKYDTDRLAVLMSQTGGCCRATNYIAFIRRALDRAGMPHIPVISLNANRMETNSGFSITPKLIIRGGAGMVFGDLIMRCLYATRPYEDAAGSANALADKWIDECGKLIMSEKFSKKEYSEYCRRIVAEFDALPEKENLRKPKVGIVGEILVKYMPLANGHLVELLEREGAEAVVPDMMDFFLYSAYNQNYRHDRLGGRASAKTLGNAAIRVLGWVRKPATDALNASRRFHAPTPISELCSSASRFISPGNQYGEGWFLTGEMVHLIETGVPNIVCIQPFGCLPNHIVGKGVLKAVRAALPSANIAAVDYDPGASEVNQLNRIKLMLTEAKKHLPVPEQPKRETVQS